MGHIPTATDTTCILREGGPISYEARPSASFQPDPPSPPTPPGSLVKSHDLKDLTDQGSNSRRKGGGRKNSLAHIPPALSQVDMLSFRYKSVNSSAENSPGRKTPHRLESGGGS